MKIFIMAERHLWTKVLRSNDVSVELERDYTYAMFQSLLICLGADVIETKYKDPGISVREDEYFRSLFFVRDPVVVIPDLKTIIYTTEKMQHEVQPIIDAVPKHLGYKVVQIPNAHIEGGNIFYVHDKKLFLHGPNIDKTFTSDSISNDGIRKVLKLDVKAIVPSLQLLHSPTLATHYYHIDCYMHLLPDGRLLILNKKMLHPACRQSLEQTFGNRFVDLEYENYLTEPQRMNFITIKNESCTTIIGTPCVELLRDKFIALGIYVITRSTLDTRSHYYDDELAEKVASELRGKGFTTATSRNLGTHLPRNKYGYLLDDETRADSSLLSLAKSKNGLPYSDVDYVRDPFYYHFTFGLGGPHCLTLDLKGFRSRYATPTQPHGPFSDKYCFPPAFMLFSDTKQKSEQQAEPRNNSLSVTSKANNIA